MSKKLMLLLGVAFILVEPAFAQLAETKVFIVRHADRDGNADALTKAGRKRAQELKRILRSAGIDSIYSTDFLRTRETAAPLAAALGRPLIPYSDIPQLIRRIRQYSEGKRLLIVGHSNTLDDLIRSCGCKPPPFTEPEMPATMYDNLFVVLMGAGRPPTCELLHLKYGANTD